MPIPQFNSDGVLPPGIHAATLREVVFRFGTGSKARQRQIGLLREVVEAAKSYPSIKRVLIWGSFVTAKLEPRDLDYSVVVSVDHDVGIIAGPHQRFLVPVFAHRRYGADRGYLLLRDYPLDYYMDRLNFLCHRKNRQPCGIIEISLRGEVIGDS